MHVVALDAYAQRLASHVLVAGALYVALVVVALALDALVRRIQHRRAVAELLRWAAGGDAPARRQPRRGGD